MSDIKKPLTVQRKEAYQKIMANPAAATVDDCLLAVAYSPGIIKTVPSSLLTEEMCIICVRKKSSSLKNIPEEFKSELVCATALQNDASVIPYIPQCIRMHLIYRYFIEKAYGIYGLPPEYRTIQTYKSLLKIYAHASNDENNDQYRNLAHFAHIYLASQKYPLDLIRLERRLSLRRTLESSFSKETHTFYVIESHYRGTQISEFHSFSKFYNYLDKQLCGADLTELDIDAIDRSKFDYTGAHLPSDFLICEGTYDATFYNEHVAKYSTETFAPPILTEENSTSLVLHDGDGGAVLNPDCDKIFYITDIHLNHRLLQEFPQNATRDEVRLFIKKYIEQMASSFNGSNYHTILVGGDVSFDFEISKLFYQELRHIWASNIVAILGNHELWGYSMPQNEKDPESIFLHYRLFFEEMNIQFLHNDLLIGGGRILHADQIMEASTEDIRNLTLATNRIIFGTTGFSGYNHIYNASCGLYCSTLRSIEDDLKYTKQAEGIYEKIAQALGDRHIIVLSHTPLDDWCRTKHIPGWIYVNGHTHHNSFETSDERTIYADNQMGYKEKKPHLKCFLLNRNYDIFHYYSDGIYKISKQQLEFFGRGKNVKCSFNKEVDHILMLKRDGLYLFLAVNKAKHTLSILNGGLSKRLKNPDVNYYYDNMTKYSNYVKTALQGYHETLKAISNIVKRFGGSGYIHGCIVDISFFDHIYLDPYTGKITPYYSPKYGERYEYSSIELLLQKHCPSLYSNYQKMLVNNASPVPFEITPSTVKTITEIHSFSQYKPSNLMKRLQYLTEKGIIRYWNDDFIKNTDQYLSGEKELPDE